MVILTSNLSCMHHYHHVLRHGFTEGKIHVFFVVKTLRRPISKQRTFNLIHSCLVGQFQVGEMDKNLMVFKVVVSKYVCLLFFLP